MKIKKSNKKGAHFGLILVVIFVIILIILAGFWFSGLREKKLGNYEGVSEIEPKLKITELKLCNGVDENFYCYENTEDIFKRGENVYVYFIVDNIKAKNIGNSFKIGIFEDRYVYGPDNTLITELKSKKIVDIEREVDEGGLYNIPIKNELITSLSDEKGTYRVNILVRDKFSNQKDQKIINFRLR